jgi:hypothetical protein
MFFTHAVVEDHIYYFGTSTSKFLKRNVTMESFSLRTNAIGHSTSIVCLKKYWNSQEELCLDCGVPGYDTILF